MVLDINACRKNIVTFCLFLLVGVDVLNCNKGVFLENWKSFRKMPDFWPMT